MGNSFVLFDVSIVISHGQFHCGNRGHTQNTDFPWVKSHFPVGKRSSGTTANVTVMIPVQTASNVFKYLCTLFNRNSFLYNLSIVIRISWLQISRKIRIIQSGTEKH